METKDINWTEFRKDLKDCLSTIEQKYGLSLEAKSISYDETTFSFPVKAVVLESGKSVEQILFEKNCFKYGLTKEDFNAKIILGGEEYKLIGVNTRARKYPFILKKLDGTKIKADSTVLRNKEKVE